MAKKAAKKAQKKRNRPYRRRKSVKVSVTDGTWESMKAIHDEYGWSDFGRSFAHYNELIDDPNIKLKQWEIEAVRDFIKKFNIKYNSPLAKALE